MWPWNASTIGEVYILHFHQPLGNPANRRAQAQHYCGFAIVAAALARNIAFDVYHWPACLLVEKLIKARKETAVFCPTCARASGRKVRPLPIPALQLALPFDDELPDVPQGSMDWLELKIQAEWRAVRIPTPAGIDDDLL